MGGVQWIPAIVALGGTVGLTLCESFLRGKTALQIIGTAWIVVSFVRWLSGSRPAETPQSTEAATAPRKFLFRRAVRAGVCAVPLAVDIFCSTSSEWVEQWLPHNTNAEESLRCAGGSVGFILVLAFCRKYVIDRNMNKVQITLAVIGGLSLSIGPALALRYDTHDRGLAVVAALARTAWLLLFSTHYISDVGAPKTTVHAQRLLFWGAAFVAFTFRENPALVLAGVGVGILALAVFYLQNPLLTLCILSVTGAGLSVSELQIGITLFSMLCLACSRYSCHRSQQFQRLSTPPSTEPAQTVTAEI